MCSVVCVSTVDVLDKKKVAPKLSKNLTCRKCEGYIGEEEKKCDEVVTVWELTYLGDIVRAGG